MGRGKVFEVERSLVEAELASRSLGEFAMVMRPGMDMSDFHVVYYRLLDLFAQGRIRRLIISVPPQHGKSLGASNFLPAYLLGVKPDLKICVGSYSFSLARRFGLGVQRLIGERVYESIFPRTFLKGMRKGVAGGEAVLRTADEFGIVGAKGGLRLVGRECALTGSEVDVMVMDDLYKDAMEANSPVVREAVWSWYTAVVRTRMHNDSQELVVFTRWHDDDLIGRIAGAERVVDVRCWEDVELVGKDDWVRVNFEAIKTGCATELDGRDAGMPLWGAKHSSELLERKRRLDPVVFDALYQGSPSSKEGLLYGEFRVYGEFCVDGAVVMNYTDTADVGDDRLCSICYVVGEGGDVFVLDVVYSDESMEVTEVLVADMLRKWRVRQALVESNSGGRGFARAVQRRIVGCVVRCFHQGANKESRILTNASLVNARVVMPEDWKTRWGEFAVELTRFRRVFKANRFDDAADALTGVVETEFVKPNRKIQSIKFG